MIALEMKVNELINWALIEEIEATKSQLMENISTFVSFSQSLCSVFMLIYFAIRIYPLIAGDQRLEIMPLMRPFAIALVIMFWPQFVGIINSLSTSITNAARTEFINDAQDVSNLTERRLILQDSVITKIIKASTEIERENLSLVESAIEKVSGVDIAEIKSEFNHLGKIVSAKIKYYLSSFWEWVIFTLFQACVNLVFCLQVIVMAILAILGPVSFAFSVLPAWWKAWTQWLSRYISVSLWSCVAYIILKVIILLVKFGVQAEVDHYQAMLQLSEANFYAAGSSWGIYDSCIYIVTLLVGIVSMIAVFPISTWIVPTSGGQSAVTAAAGGAARIGSSFK